MFLLTILYLLFAMCRYSNHLQQPSSNSTLSEDPFSVFESTSKPPRPSSGVFSDHLEEFGQFSGATRAKDDSGDGPFLASLMFSFAINKGTFHFET